jgi:UDP-glucose 4-epimerase
VIGATRALTAAGTAGVRRVVLMSSVGVYGPSTGPEPVTEDAPPRPNSFQFSQDKALQELAAHSSASTAGLELAIARPCTVVGGAGANFVLELLAGPIVPLPAYTDAEWQFLHVDDFCTGVIALLASSATGPYNLVPADAVPLREAVRRLGGHPVSLPRALLAGAARATWALHAGRAVPPAALAFLDRPPIASGARADRDLGFAPALGSRGALLAAGRSSAPVDRSLRLVPQGRR